MLGMKATSGTALILDAGLINSFGMLVAWKDRFDAFMFGSWTHNPIFLGS
jgi:hypothetical protein